MSGLRRAGLALTIATLLPALVTSVSPAAASPHGVPLDELRVVTTEVATGLVRPIAMVGVDDR